MASENKHQRRLSPEEIQRLSLISPELKELIDRNGPLPRLQIDDPQACKVTFREADKKFLETKQPLEILEEYSIEIQVSYGWKSFTTVCRPSSKVRKGPGPLIVLYYGGGFMVGSPHRNSLYARSLARLLDAVVVCPSYRLAPEYKFPTGITDAWDCLKWAAMNAESLGADPTKGFIVGGVSAGANYTTVLTRKSVEEKLSPPVTGHWASMFAAFRDHTVPRQYKEQGYWTSWEQNKDAMIHTTAEIETIFSYYEPDYESPLFNPFATGFNISQLPPAYVQVAGMDACRDDGIVYAYALEDAGVPVKLDAYPGVPHSFFAFVPTLPQAKTARADIARGFAWLLGVQKDEEEVLQAIS